MPAITVPTSRSSEAVEQTIRTISIHYLTEVPAGGRVLRSFIDPQVSLAVQQAGDGAPLEVFSTTDAKVFRLRCAGAVVVDTELGKVSWQAGRAAILATPANAETLMSAVIDFDFYHSQLRKLEEAIVPHQQAADADVALAYNIRQKDRSQWDRLYQSMEDLYRLRLSFARLEPHLGTSDLSLPLEARRAFNRLLVKAKIESRLEALNDRLETIEDLYEGAIDRITDFRNYRKGVLLEVGIVGLLMLETILLLVQAFHGK